MSCGRTSTRRQAHGKRRASVVNRRMVKRTGPSKSRYSKSMQAWIKAHPFKPFTAASTAAWDKKHPLKRFTRRQYLAWIRAHPFSAGGHTKKQAVTHKITCQVKTRHAVKAGKRIVITTPVRKKAVKAAKALKAK